MIATDCISEGQNLQDCDYLINYDIHWNPVRLVQRFGRIDRIGSENKSIQMVNFWPNINMEEYIRLETRVKAKMQKVIQASTADENVLNSLSYEEINKLSQLKALEEKAIDLEEIKGNVSFSNLTYSEFETDLKIYLEKNKSNKQPDGIFSIAKSDEICKEGIIFLFKSMHTKNENNKFDPYYLIYISNNEKIIYTYDNTAQILNLYKRIANSQKDVNKFLFDKFNEKTKYGKDMSMYVSLLNKAIESINSKKEDQELDGLFNPEITSTKNYLDDYVLISFLIVDRGI